MPGIIKTKGKRAVKGPTLTLPSGEHYGGAGCVVGRRKTSTLLSADAAGGIAIMLPRFHCEINSIELVWGRSKWCVRRYFKYTMRFLRDNVYTYVQYYHIYPYEPLQYEPRGGRGPIERLSMVAQKFCRKLANHPRLTVLHYMMYKDACGRSRFANGSQTHPRSYGNIAVLQG